MKYMVTKEIKSETRVIWSIYAQDFLFLVICVAVTLMTKKNVHETLRVLYVVFSFTVAIIMVLPNAGNPKRRNYQAVAILFLRPRCVYKFMGKEKNNNDQPKKGKRKRHDRTDSN